MIDFDYICPDLIRYTASYFSQADFEADVLNAIRIAPLPHPKNIYRYRFLLEWVLDQDLGI